MIRIVHFLLKHAARRFPEWARRRSAGDPNAIWTWNRMTDWVTSSSSMKVMAEYLGLRSDGTFFCVRAEDVAEAIYSDSWGRRRKSHEYNMRASLDRFLHCRCGVDRPCLLHFIESGYGYRSALHAVRELVFR